VAVKLAERLGKMHFVLLALEFVELLQRAAWKEVGLKGQSRNRESKD